MDGSSFINLQGERCAGHVVVTLDDAEAEPLPQGTSAPKAELIALTRALELREGDRVWIKDWNMAPLRPWWKGPQTVILITPTAVKVEGIPAWIHHSYMKPAAAETWEAKPILDNPCKVTLRKTTSPASVTPGS